LIDARGRVFAFVFGHADMQRGPLACRSVDCYRKLGRIDEGTYGVVYKAQDKDTGEIVALKRLKLENEREGFPITALREISALMHAAPHPNIVSIREVVSTTSVPSSFFIAMEFVPHDLRAVLDDRQSPFSEAEAKSLVRQLLMAVQNLHHHWIIHRDLKTTNLLLTRDGVLKVADFGMARRLGSPNPGRITPDVITLWYRAPELFLGQQSYSWPVDVWSVGCVMAEILTSRPLFAGQGELQTLHAIFKTLGFPTPLVWPAFNSLPNAHLISSRGMPSMSSIKKQFSMISASGVDLLSRLLAYDPSRRIRPSEALEHPWFAESPLPCLPVL